MVNGLQNIRSNGNGYFSQAVAGYAARMKPKDGQNEGKPKTIGEFSEKLLGKGKQAPYSLMADETGIIEYKGVVFRCDYEHNRLCLGDVSNSKNCITVGLEKGGCLVFNRANIDDLVRAIGMFSPEDVNRIMRAIAEDAKIRQTQMQIEDETSGVEVLDKPDDEKKEVVNQPEENEEYESERQNEQSDF